MSSLFNQGYDRIVSTSTVVVCTDVRMVLADLNNCCFVGGKMKRLVFECRNQVPFVLLCCGTKHNWLHNTG